MRRRSFLIASLIWLAAPTQQPFDYKGLVNIIANREYYKLSYPPDQYLYWVIHYRQSVQSKELLRFQKNNYKWFLGMRVSFDLNETIIPARTTVVREYEQWKRMQT